LAYFESHLAKKILLGETILLIKRIIMWSIA